MNLIEKLCKFLLRRIYYLLHTIYYYMKKGPLGWLIGIVTGTLVGILFAPKKGEELRKNLKKERQKGGVGLDTLKGAYKGLGKEIADSAKEGYQLPEVQKVVRKAKKGLEDVKKTTRALIHDGMEQMEHLADKAKKQGGKTLNDAMAEVKKVVKKKTTKKKK